MSVLTLNESATFLWQALALPATADDLARRLAQEFEVGADAASADVSTFLGQLREAGLLVAAT